MLVSPLPEQQGATLDHVAEASVGSLRLRLPLPVLGDLRCGTGRTGEAAAERGPGEEERDDAETATPQGPGEDEQDDEQECGEAATSGRRPGDEEEDEGTADSGTSLHTISSLWLRRIAGTRCLRIGGGLHIHTSSVTKRQTTRSDQSSHSFHVDGCQVRKISKKKVKV